MTLHNNQISPLQHFINEQAEQLITTEETNLITAILDAIERVLATDGINEPAQVQYFIKEGESFLSIDPHGQKLFQNIQKSINKKDAKSISVFLTELYQWLNASFEEVKGI